MIQHFGSIVRATSGFQQLPQRILLLTHLEEEAEEEVKTKKGSNFLDRNDSRNL
jgi:hypothetical protein